MIYKLNINKISDKFLEKIYHSSMRDLGKFYGIKWKINTPKIIVLKDRKSIDSLNVQKTAPWFVGWADDRTRTIFILGRKELEKHSSHKYSKKHYSSLIKHEISHLFYRIVSSGRRGPFWLSEGVAIYTSGQNKLKTKPSGFKNFLDFYEKTGSGVYLESGFAVETLVKRFGKNKMLKLIKSLKNVANEKQFNKTFKTIYGFQVTYKNVNELYSKIK